MTYQSDRYNPTTDFQRPAPKVEKTAIGKFDSDLDESIYGTAGQVHRMFQQWQPAPWLVKHLNWIGISDSFLENSVESYIQYWMTKDRESFRSGWNTSFKHHIYRTIQYRIDDDLQQDKEKKRDNHQRAQENYNNHPKFKDDVQIPF